MIADPTPLAVLEGSAQWTVVRMNARVVLESLPDRAVDHVITDPPYEAEAHTQQRRVRGNVEGSEREVVEAPLPFAAIVEADREWYAIEFARVAKRWICVFCQAEALVRWRDAIVKPVMLKALTPIEPLARYMRACVWIKPDGQPQLTGDRPGMGYESICVCHANTGGRSRWNGGGSHGVFVHMVGGQSKTRAGHPTEKPVSLMLELIEKFTDPGDVVLDPFAGSGTTGVACLRAGRRFIGCEIDEGFHRLAVDRLTAEVKGQSVRDWRAGQLSMFGS